jgi:hypothetical protein
MFATWFLSHICKKSRKGITPAVTNSYSPSAIVKPSICFWIRATLNHGAPSFIFPRRLPITSGPVFQRSTATLFQFAQYTSATFDAARLKIATVYDGKVPTFAFAFPARLTFALVWRSGNYFQSSKQHSNKISKGDFFESAWVTPPLPASVMHRAHASFHCITKAIFNTTPSHNSDSIGNRVTLSRRNGA